MEENQSKLIEGIKVEGDNVIIPGNILFLNTPVIVQALSRINEMPLPLPVSYRITKLMKQLQGHFKKIDEIRLDLFKLYGKETTPGTYSLEGDEEAQIKFTKDFDEMVTDIKGEFRTIKMTVSDPTSYGQNSSFTPKDLSILMDLGLLEIVE